jgi:hypothetical protein
MKNSSAFHFNECGFSAHIPSNKYVINQVFACVVYVVLFIPTVLLNGVSILTILKCAQLKGKVSYFTILNLSAVDLITGFITLPLQTAHVLVKDVIHVENKMICWTLLRLGLFPPMLSVVTLCVLSFERYMGVVHPFVHRTQVTKKRIVTFEFAAGLSMLAYKLGITGRSPGSDPIIYAHLLVLFVFLAFVYTRIFITARNSHSSAHRPRDGAAQPDISAMKRKRQFLRELKLAKSCFLVVCTFGVCFLPSSTVVSLAENFLDDVAIEMFWSWTMALAVLNSSLNSIIFFWSNATLRKEAVKVLKLCFSGP